MSENQSKTAAFGSGAIIGTLGGLIGLGGAEFRLPLLISFFRFRGLEAVILNKATSLVVVASALPFRAATISFAQIRAMADHRQPTGRKSVRSVRGRGMGNATQVRNALQGYRGVAGHHCRRAVVCAWHRRGRRPPFTGWVQIVAGIVAGFIIGVIAALLGVAGGEFLIPTLVLLFGVDIKLAGSLSLAASLPTMLVGFSRYSRDQSFAVLGQNWIFLLVMAAGSMLGTFIGGRLLGIVPTYIPLPLLAAVLVISAVKVWQHQSIAGLLYFGFGSRTTDFRSAQCPLFPEAGEAPRCPK